MATATVQLSPNIKLEADTPEGPGTAPIWYTLTIGDAGLNTRNPTQFQGEITDAVNRGVISAAEGATATAGLPQAITEVQQQLSSSATTTQPSSDPATTQTVTAETAAATAPQDSIADAPTPVSEVVVNGSPAPGSVTIVPQPPIIDEPIVNQPQVTIVPQPPIIDQPVVSSVQNTIVDTPPVITDDPSIPPNQPAVLPADFSTDPSAQGSSKGLQGLVANTQSQATQSIAANAEGQGDWRVRLALAPGATYLYKTSSDPGILAPLVDTDGVIFPYTPAISVNYAASYDAASLVHTNYKMFQYTGSSVDSITLTCEFTCQDVAEANYVLAVIHFFRSMTKMFYGQDQNPIAGTPPPLCFIYGMGSYQFSNHPLAITGFNYALPADVDYIKTTAPSVPGTVPASPTNNTNLKSSPTSARLSTTGVSPGGATPPPQFSTPTSASTVTWVPSKIQLSVSCVPIVSRNQVSNIFNLADYASGKIYDGTNNSNGGFW